MLASIDSFIGSLWFAALALVVGYAAGHIVPINKLIKLVFKKDI